LASDAEIRAWAQASGRDVSARGRVSADDKEAYAAAHNGGQADYPDGMTGDDFGGPIAEADDPADDPGAVPLDDPDMYEAAPRTVTPKVTSRLTSRRLAGRLKRGKPSGGPKPKPKPKKPRISTAELTGSAWRIMAKLATPIPPLYRTLRLQSVIAGPLIDDAVKGTAVDLFLQPAARLAQSGQTGAALLAPNMAIGMMAWHGAQCAKAGTEPNPLIMQGCAEMLRYGLIAMMRAGGDAFAAQLAREQDDERRYGADVDMIMAWIMEPPADPATEEANIAAMAAQFAGRPAETMPV
jgi:hypothetical protein